MAGDHLGRSDSHIISRSLSHVHRSDEEWRDRIALKYHDVTQIKRANHSRCFVCVFILLIVSCIAAFVFADLLLGADKPKLTLQAVHVSRLSSGIPNNVASLSSGIPNNVASLKLTAAAELKLHNGDLGRFRFRAGTITALYGSAIVGKATIKSGVVLGRTSARMNANVEIMASDRLAKNWSFISDVEYAKLVKMQWVGEVRGYVRVAKIISMDRVSFMNCTLALNLTSKAVQDLSC